MDEDLYGSAYSLTGSTGTMAASLAANSLVFSMQATANDATRPNFPARGPVAIVGLRLSFTAIVASATTIAAGRGLRVFKGLNAAQAAPAGGTALTGIPKRGLDAGSDSGLADARISTTGALTVVGFTRATVPLLAMDLSGSGGIGAQVIREYLSSVNGSPLWLDPGEILCISNPAALDALLTWQLTVDVDYFRRDSR